MDFASILGLVLCAIVVIYGIVFGQHISVLGDFDVFVDFNYIWWRFMLRTYYVTEY